MNTQLKTFQSRKLFKAIAAIVSGSCILSLPVYAQQNSSEEEVKVESVIVVGHVTDYQVDAEELDKIQANTLADIFRYQPSVTVGGSLGLAQKVYIRGMEDTLLNVTVDGAPQTATLFHHIGRVSVEPELLNQVYVQTGAGEATAGAGAIGGAIRFKTKDAQDLLDYDQQFGVLAKAGYFTNDGQKLSASAYGRISDSWGFLGSYVTNEQDGKEDGEGNEMLGVAAEQDLGFLKLSGSLTENQKLSVSYEQRNEEGMFGARPNWPVLEGDTLYPAEGERKTTVINYGFDGENLLGIEATVYSTEAWFEMDRFDAWGNYGGSVESEGFDLRNTSLLGANTLTYGVEYRKDTASSSYLEDEDVWQGWAWDPSIGTFVEEGSVTGFYIQDHLQVTNALLFSFGARYDEYEVEQVTYDDETSSDGVSLNAGLEYNITEDLALSLGYAEAMRGKEVSDVFTLERDPSEPSIAEDLQAEEVTNAEFGLVYDDGSLYASFAYYDSEIDNVILDQIGQGTYYENIGTFASDGIEVSLGYFWDKFSTRLSYAGGDAELNGHPVEGYEQIGLGNISGDRWNLSFNYKPIESVELGWIILNVEDLNNVEVLQRAVELGWIDSVQYIDKPGYTVHDLYAQWVPFGNERLKLNLTVQNATDEHYRDHSSVGDYNSIAGWEGVAGLYEGGRDIRFSVAYSF